MEEIVLTIGGLFKLFSLSDLFFFAITLFVIVLLVYVIYLSKVDDSSEPKKKDDKEISEIINELSQTQRMAPVELSEYEQEQENTAIISYEELMKAANKTESLDDYENSNVTFDSLEENKRVSSPRLVSAYETEEEFLKMLKRLQNNLVR